MNDIVNHPAHYTGLAVRATVDGKPVTAEVECIDVIDSLGLSFNLGNALKYLWRCCRKGRYDEDLRKARWYLDRQLQMLDGVAGRVEAGAVEVPVAFEPTAKAREEFKPTQALKKPGPKPKPELVATPKGRTRECVECHQLKGVTAFRAGNSTCRECAGEHRAKPTIPSKRCPKCGESKPAVAFNGETCRACYYKARKSQPAPPAPEPTNGHTSGDGVYRLSQAEMVEWREDPAELRAKARATALRMGRTTMHIQSPTGRMLETVAAEAAAV